MPFPGSFGGVKLGTYSKKSKPKSDTKSSEKKKTESTSQTYGQMILKSAVSSTNVNSSVSNVGVGSVHPIASAITKSTKSSSAPLVDSVIKGKGIKGSPGMVTKPAIPSHPSILPIIQQPLVAPKDTIVQVIQETGDVVSESLRSRRDQRIRTSDDELKTALIRFGSAGSFSCKAKSNIAVAAASTNKSAAVVLPKKGKRKNETPSLLFGALFNDFSNVARNVVEQVVVVGSNTKTKEEVKKSLTEAQKVDLTISLKSRDSESVEFNNLKVPEIDADFQYNFFTETEEDILEQEDPAKDPLLVRRPLDIPRYIELRWDMAQVTEPLSQDSPSPEKKEITELKKEAFKRHRGVAGYTKATSKRESNRSEKRIKPLNREGLSFKIPEIHEPERVFNSISNHRVFANSIGSVVNISKQKNILDTLPILAGRLGLSSLDSAPEPPNSEPGKGRFEAEEDGDKK